MSGYKVSNEMSSVIAPSEFFRTSPISSLILPRSFASCSPVSVNELEKPVTSGIVVLPNKMSSGAVTVKSPGMYFPLTMPLTDT